MLEALMQSHGSDWNIPDGWGQGKAVFGGLIAGALDEAATRRVTGGERKLRALNMTFVAAPTPGAATLPVVTLREGGGSTTLDARVVQQGATVSTATLVFSKPRPNAERFVTDPVPFDRDWQKAEAMVVDADNDFAPQFTQHFEYRPTLGVPFSGDRAETAGWVRPRAFSGRYGPATLAACIDAYWHAFHARAQQPTRAATVGFALELYDDASTVEPGAPVFHHGVTWAAGTGYGSERRTLWSPDGRLLAVNHQSIGIFG
ncbi:MAG: thioesterase family protein [Myxococcaceae bacterium]|nr:thioesterase family protein [Myxococcaceae bacterium]